MNSVSIFVYVADVIGRISVLLIFAGLLTLAITAVLFIITGLHNDSIYDKREKKPYPKKQGFAALLLAFFIFFLAALMPSQTAMYMIAASEAGELIVKSPEAQEVFNDLKAVIRKNLKRAAGADTPNNSN